MMIYFDKETSKYLVCCKGIQAIGFDRLSLLDEMIFTVLNKDKQVLTTSILSSIYESLKPSQRLEIKQLLLANR
jgi:kynurenine formamidase